MGGDKKCPPPTGSTKSDKSVKNGKKPNLRGLHLKQTLRHVYISLGLSAISGALFYVFNNRRRIAAYENFYATYDAEESFNRMREAGVLSSCPPEPPPEPPKKQNCLFSLVME